MTEDEANQMHRYEGASIVEGFRITGLHGYRGIEFNAPYMTSILIARNGSGKTTLLAILNAVLRRNFFRLLGVRFESIECKIRGESEIISIKRDELDRAFTPPQNSEFQTFLVRTSLSADQAVRFITEEWDFIENDNDPSYESKNYSAVKSAFGFRRSNIAKIVNELRDLLYRQSEGFYRSYLRLERALKSYEILYLPTYRRVELALRDDNVHRRRRPQIEVARDSLFTGDIQFGLSDIADRLRELNEQIVYKSNSEYRRISAAIISDFLDGTFEKHVSSDDNVPQREDLQVLFSRVERSPRYGPHFAVGVPDIERIYDSTNISEPSQKFLNYFLSQLNRVITSTSEVEQRAALFVEICNSYLMNDDISLDLPDHIEVSELDGKRLRLDKKDLRLSVISTFGDRPIGLDALSSGEKQMISLFAKLHLYEKPKIVLIDEPELSLSIDWQRKILVDVANSPVCHQLIAITHSPFVFDNELDPFASSLGLWSDAAVIEDLFEELDEFKFEENSYDG